jgi:ammonia channel protein AmtB
VPLSSLALVGVPEHDAGAASATLNATQQVGGSLGTALLNTISTSAITAYLAANVVAGTAPTQTDQLKAQIQGYSTAFTWAAGIILAAAVVTAIFIKVRKEDLPTGDAVPQAG